jgi:hypothetical protein
MRQIHNVPTFFFLPPALDVLPSDGFLAHLCPSSGGKPGGKLFIDPPSFLLSKTGSRYILPRLTLMTPRLSGERLIVSPAWDTDSKQGFIQAPTGLRDEKEKEGKGEAS